MNNVLEKVKDAKRIGISGHIRPDGDCVGSCMALYLYLKEYKKEAEVDLYLEYIPDNLAFIKDTDKALTNYDKDAKTSKYDMFFALDCGDIDRLGDAKKYFLEAEYTICIDHHISNTKFAKENYVIAESSSTCECLYDWLLEDKITLPIAEALYTGLIHDTGVFMYSNTKKNTMKIAGTLIEKGVPFSKIIDESFYSKTYVQNQILGRCLLESMMVLDGKCILSVITQKILEFYGATSKDLDGIVNQLRITNGVEVAVFIHEVSKGEYKVSMRSNDKVDVSKVAVDFGGGGHIKAAGCTINGSIYDIVNNLTRHIEAQLNVIDKKEAAK